MRLIVARAGEHCRTKQIKAWIDGAGFVVNTRSLITYCLHPSTGHGMADKGGGDCV
jgi:hypothetical protein